ncbi:MAG: hypothetical protein ABIJ25_05565 [Pseudomonadota bacterium]
MASKKDQENALREFIKNCPKKGISKAPPPITPLSGYGVTYSRPQKTDRQKEFFVPITGTELMKKWSVGWEAIFDWERQKILTPEQMEWRENYRVLMSVYTQNDREEYFAQWLYRPHDVESFEIKYPHIIDEWREKAVSREDIENPNAGTIVRQEQTMAIAREVKRDFPNLTIKEAAQKINAPLAASNWETYSIKHLMRLIKPLGFKPGKPGRISQK